MHIMNKKLYITTLFVGMLALSSCNPEQEDLFDETSTERFTTEMNRVRDLLVGAENGWNMDYYGDLTYGGYNVLLKFDRDSVTVGSEKAAAHHIAGLDDEGRCITARSHYKLEQSMGVVLSVDEYNEVFHYFSMPDNPDFGYKDTGFEGDFEFRIIKADKDSIIMRGKKHNNRIVMTPIQSDTSWESILKDAAETQTFIDSRNYTLWSKDSLIPDCRYDSVSGAWSYNVVCEKIMHTLRFQWRDSIGQLNTVVAPFISKKDGYHFYAPYEVKGVEIDGIQKGDSRSIFYTKNNDALWLYPYLPTLLEHLTGGQWFIAYSNLGTYGQQCWDTFRETYKKRDSNLDVGFAYIGTDGTRFALHFNLDNQTVYEGLDYTTNDAQDEIKLNWNLTEASTAKKNHKRWGIDYALMPFTGGNERTFTISTDNQRDPTYLLLTDQSDPNNVIKLSANVIYYPFNY